MKLVVTALLESFAGIINVVIVILLVWIMFGILGVSLIKNKMGFCSTVEIPYGINKASCLNGWKIYNTNFDNIINALITLFSIST